MRTLWQTIFIQPIETALFFLADQTGSLGVAIILLTTLLQLLLLPLRLPSLRTASKMKELKPELDTLKEKHKKDPQALIEAQMSLYREHGISPFGGIGTMLLSLPIVIALYQVLRNTFSSGSESLFLWLDLAHPDTYYILPLVVGISQWLMTKTSGQTAPSGDKNTEDMAQTMQKQMQFIFPVLLAIITMQLPSGVGIYFIVSAWFAIIQQIWIQRQSQKSNN